MWPGTSPSAAVNGAAKMIIAALIIAGLYVGRELLIPLTLAGLLSFVLSPLVRQLVQWKWPHALSVGVVIAIVLAVLTGAAAVTGRQAAEVVRELTLHEANLLDKARSLNEQFGGAGIWQRAVDTLRNVELEVRDPRPENEPTKIEVAKNGDQFWSTLLEYTRMSLRSLVTLGLVLLLTVFMLLQYSDLRDRGLRLMGTREIGRTAQAFDEAGSDLAHFLLLQSSVNASFGLYIGLSLWVIGIPSPAVWGTLAAIMRFVPYIGAFISAAFPLALAATVDPGWTKVIETAGVFLVGEPLVGQLVEPLLFGSKTRLSPLAILVSATFWTLLWGPLGLILAVPLTLAIVVMGQHISHLDFLRILLGNEPPLAPKEKLYHQFLAGEAAEAAKDADQWINNQTFENYLDEVAIPSLVVASTDQKRGVLRREQQEVLSATILEYIELVKESLEFNREQHAEAAAATRGERASAPVLVLAGRGNLDLAASELLSDAIRLRLKVGVRCPSLGGLTGISAAAESEPHPDVVVLVSVGLVTVAQLELLRLRIKRTFQKSQLLIANLDKQKTDYHKVDASQAVGYPDSVITLVDGIGRLLNKQPPVTTLPVRREAEAAA